MHKFSYLVFAALLLLTSPALSREARTFATLNLAELGRSDFLIERRALMQRLTAAGPGADTDAATHLDLAELYLSKMLLAEATSYLEALDVETLSSLERQRQETLSVAISLLSGRDGLVLAVSRSANWSQGRALRAAAFARLGADVAVEDLMPQILDALPELSSAIIGAILPDLLEAALDAGEWDVARALAEQFPDHPELRDAPSYRFLLARAADLAGDVLMAFDGYASAAEGRDAYAHRARIELVRLGRRTDTLPLEDAIALLDVAQWAWRGDAVAAEGLELLYDYALGQGDSLVALSALGRLVADAATPEAAEAARQRARLAISNFYDAGAAGDIGLGAFLDGHGEIKSRWQFNPGFIESAAALPQTFLDVGMTAIAAREFRALRDIAVVAGELNLFTVAPDVIAALRLSEARALLAGGQADKAIEVLSGFPESRQDGYHEAERLLIWALSRAGRSEELAGLRERALDTESRRTRAVALYEIGNWDAARKAFLELWEAYPSNFSFPDATRLILAAYEVGDVATVSRIAAAFPILTDHPGWADIAAGLAPQTTNFEALTSDVMRMSVKNASRALSAVDEATGATKDE